MQIMVRLKVHKLGNHLYLVIGNQEYYLFSQKYKQSVVDYYSKGVTLRKALDFTKSKRDIAITKTMEKLPMYIKSFEKEFGIKILNMTARRNAA